MFHPLCQMIMQGLNRKTNVKQHKIRIKTETIKSFPQKFVTEPGNKSWTPGRAADILHGDPDKILKSTTQALIEKDESRNNYGRRTTAEGIRYILEVSRAELEVTPQCRKVFVLLCPPCVCPHM